MNVKIVAIAIGVAGVLLAAGVLMAVWPPQQPDPDPREESKFTLPEEETVSMGANGIIGGQLSDSSGRALGSEAVYIDATLPDGSTAARTTVVTDETGAFDFAVSPTMSGQYNVTVTFGGNAQCKPSSYVVVVVVIVPPIPAPISTVLTMSGPGTVDVGGVADIEGVLKTDRGGAISWASIAVKITGPDGIGKRSTAVTGADGKFPLAIAAESASDYIVEASFDGYVMYGPSSATFSFRAVSEPVPPPPDPSEPKLNIAYISGTWGNTVRYGMPEQRSGPYPWNDFQWPGANEFRIESNGYGPDQPDGPVEIATFIKISGIGPRWVGSTEIPAGTVEVRTFPPDAVTPRLVNLFATPDGGCQGILVNDWAVFDHTWVYEEGVTDNHQLTFSLDITMLGDYAVTVWEVHDHGDGKAVRVSNEISWTVHVDGSNICSASMDPPWIDYTNGTAYTVTSTVQRNTEPDDDNVNVMNTIAYSGVVHNYLWIEGTSGYTVRINGVVQTGTTVDGGLRFDLGTLDFGSEASRTYAFTVAADDGRSHEMRMQTFDAETNAYLGGGYGHLWHRYW